MSTIEQPAARPARPLLRAVFEEAARYVSVSGIAFIADFALYLGLLSAATPVLLAAFLGKVFGTGVHYLISSRLVFRGRIRTGSVKEELGSLGGFVLASAAGTVATLVTIWALMSFAGLGPVVAKVLSAGVSICVVYATLRASALAAPVVKH